MIEDKSIFLIINFSYPPYPGTGGRRWAKLSKELCRRGFEVCVMGAKRNSGELSSWANDVKLPEINYFPVDIPFSNNSLFLNIQKKFLKYFTHLNYNDLSYLYLGGFKKTIRKILSKDSNNFIVILSFPPYGLTDLIPYLKQMQRKMIIISDIRDIHSFYLKSIKTSKAENLEKRFFKNILYSDIILSVNDYFTELYRGLNADVVCQTLHNFYDEDDIINFPCENIRSSEKIIFTYTGNLIPECRPYVESFLNALLFIREKNPELFCKFRVNIFGNKDEFILNRVHQNKLTQTVNFMGHIPANESQRMIQSSDFCLIFPADFYYLYSLETKFFEYTLHRKPIITFPESGLCSELIRTNNLGVSLPVKDCGASLLNFITKYLNHEFKYNDSFQIQEYSLKNACDKLLNIIRYRYET